MNPVLPNLQIPRVFKRFVLWIRFVLGCSKDLFCGFVLCRTFQKICFVDSFCKKKKSKRFVFVLIWKDSCTNPASFVFIICKT